MDGTLTDTNGVDDACYLKAFEDTFGITEINADWESYPHTTDSAIALHIFQTKFERAPQAEEIQKHKARFLELLQIRSETKPAQFKEICGAGKMLEQLKREKKWAIAIATGSRREAAWLKMKTAKIEGDHLPIASADDGLSREEILQLARAKALKVYRQTRFEKTVSVGDGVWDVRTAANLKIPFLGVGDEKTAEKLRRAGANIVLENFADYDLFLSSLENAEVPQSGK